MTKLRILSVFQTNKKQDDVELLPVGFKNLISSNKACGGQEGLYEAENAVRTFVLTLLLQKY